MKIMKTALLLLIVFSWLPGSFASAEKTELLIGVIPEMNVFKQVARFTPLTDYLSKETGVSVKISILSRYGNIIDSFSSEQLDGAFFGSFTGAMGIQKLGVVPLARPVNLDGQSTYHAYIYTRKDSGIKTVADMRGKKFAFVEKATTAGYIFPLAYLKEHGVENIDNYFSEYFYSGSHDASLHAVLQGDADVGASKNTVFDWVAASNPQVTEEIVILARSSTVPSNALCVRKGLPDDIKSALQKALLDLHKTPEGEEVLKKFKALKFIETSLSDYDPVFEFAKNAGIDIKAYNYRNE